jgi:hypothetical protein
MSKQDNNDNNDELEDVETYVYIPDEGIYGTIVRYGAWASMINYYDGGVSYTVELPNDEFIVVDETGVGYYAEEEEGFGYPEDEEYL